MIYEVIFKNLYRIEPLQQNRPDKNQSGNFFVDQNIKTNFIKSFLQNEAPIISTEL